MERFRGRSHRRHFRLRESERTAESGKGFRDASGSNRTRLETGLIGSGYNSYTGRVNDEQTEPDYSPYPVSSSKTLDKSLSLSPLH